MRKINSSGFRIVLIVVFTILAIAGFVGCEIWRSLNVNNKKINDSKIIGENLYFTNQGNLLSVNVKTKAVNKIADKITADSLGRMHMGTNDPLNAYDFSKVAYIKDNSVFIYDGAMSKRIDQPDASGKAVDIFLSSWSYDTKYLLYYFDQGNPLDNSSPQDDIDESITGFYVYSVMDNKSSKLPIPSSDGWVPNSSKISYLDNDAIESTKSNLRVYDVTSGADSLLSKKSFYGVDSVDFSYDGSKIVYRSSVYNDLLGKSEVSIVSANADNTNPKTRLTGEWADFRTQIFKKFSNSEFIYQKRQTEVCDNVKADNMDGSCYGDYLMLSDSAKKYSKVGLIVGAYDENNIIVLSDRTSKRVYASSLTMVDISNGFSKVLYDSDGVSTITLGIGKK